MRLFWILFVFISVQTEPLRIGVSGTVGDTEQRLLSEIENTLASQLNTPASLEAGASDARLTLSFEAERLSMNARQPQLRTASPMLVDHTSAMLDVDAPDVVPLVVAMAAYTAGDWQAAINVDLAATADTPHAVTALVSGNASVMMGDIAQAADIYRTGLPEVPSEGDAALVTNLAWSLFQLGQQEDAFALFDRALAAVDAAEREVNLHAGRASLHALAFQFDPAIADITIAIELAEELGLPETELARLYTQRGDHIFLIYEWDRVLADYNRAIEIDPRATDAYFARGVLFYTQGPRPRALDDFERFVRLFPDDPRVPEAQTYINAIQVELEALDGSDTRPFGPTD